jgi:hypothetical protein
VFQVARAGFTVTPSPGLSEDAQTGVAVIMKTAIRKKQMFFTTLIISPLFFVKPVVGEAQPECADSPSILNFLQK